MNQLVLKVKEYMQIHHMVDPGSKIVVGVSGGPDSVALFYILLELADRMKLSLAVVHINHGIRGKEADSDQAYVENICQKEHVPCHCFYIDLKDYAKKTGMSEEEAGRAYRYQCFEKVRKEESAQKIAVAHQQEDTCETVLMNLFRGTGIRGLAGIPAVRGTIIRPLLSTGRGEIEAYLEEKGIPWCTDATNLTEAYTRNKIRNRLLPYIEEQINPAAGRHIQEASGLLKDIADYVDRQAMEAFESCTFRDDDGLEHVDREQFIRLDPVIQREVLRRAIKETAGKLKDIEREHIEMLRHLMEKQVGRSCSLPYKIRAVRTYKGMVIQREDEVPLKKMKAFSMPVEAPGEYCLPGGSRILLMKVEEIGENKEIPVNSYTKWFDYDKMKNGLTVRTRQSGDFITMDESGHRKLLKRWMIDEKIPKEERDTLLLLAEGSHIIWIIGYRISESYKISCDTKRKLIVKVKGEKSNGR